MSKITADIVTVSHPHPGHSHTEAVGGSPKLVDRPGEYEISEVFITGVGTYHDEEEGKKLGKNVAYLIELDNLVVCHLGDLGHIPSPQHIEAMSDVDILLIPVGGNNTINAAQAAEVISLIEPRIVVPMHYRIPGLKVDLDPVEKFCRQMGMAAPTPQGRLNVTREGLPSEPQVAILEPRRLS